MDDTCHGCYLRHDCVHKPFRALQAIVSNMDWGRKMLTSFGFGHSGLFCLGFLYINRHYLCSTTCFDAIQGADETSDKGIYQYGAWAWCSVGQTWDQYSFH
jgi:hypothetical protein